MPAGGLDDRIAAVRRFNRFYTQKIGVLRDGLLDSPFSLTEARVLYELAHRERLTASDVGGELGLDPGYLSRVLRGFQRRQLIERTSSATDRRQRHLSLTAAGRAALAPLDEGSRAAVAGLLAPLAQPAQHRLVAAMHDIEQLLGQVPPAVDGCVLRRHRPGDMGWIVGRQAAIYAEEYGWDESFEAMVAAMVATIIASFNARRERCWIAEKDGVPVGSVALVSESDDTGRLRLLVVEPRARGFGIGRRLVAECIRFAREVGYRRVTLSTYSVLLAARHLYEVAGFRLVATEPQHRFGRDLVDETWELDLSVSGSE